MRRFSILVSGFSIQFAGARAARPHFPDGVWRPALPQQKLRVFRGFRGSFPLVTKNEIADVLNEIALLLELKGENPFKVRAYQTGARVVESFEQAELERLIAGGELQTVKGIGEALGKKITELQATGKLEFFENLKASVAPGLVELLEIPGLGPKKIKVLFEKLGVADIASLTQACCDGRVAGLAGFGAKTQEKILAGIKNREAYGKRHIWWDAWLVADPIVQGLRALPQVKRAEAAGSLRRGLETVGDLDFIVSATEVAPVVAWFVAMPGVQEVTARGETKASVRFTTGLQADLRLVPDEQFVFALHHFTGSKDHNVQMRQRALARGLSLSEWGLVPAEGEGTVKAKARVTPPAGARCTPPGAASGGGLAARTAREAKSQTNSTSAPGNSAASRSADTYRTSAARSTGARPGGRSALQSTTTRGGTRASDESAGRTILTR
jgi:DNA polymerase (family 10)